MDLNSRLLMLGFGGGKAVSDYWIARFGSAIDENNASAAVDSLGNTYVGGTTAAVGAGSIDGLLVKFNALGELQWQRTLGATSADYIRGVMLDSSNNVYIVGYTYAGATTRQDAFIAKYNSSGAIQWQRTLGGSNDETTSAGAIAVDGTGNVHIAATTKSAGSGAVSLLVAKYNTSGVIQWQRVLTSTGIDSNPSIAVDGSGSVYIHGYTEFGATDYSFLLAKYNSSGTLQWTRTLGGASFEFAASVAVDSSGNAYIAGRTNSVGVGAFDCLIAKYDTTGAIQWQRTLGQATFDDDALSLTTNSAGDLYVSGYTSVSGGKAALIAKYNGSGVLQWQRTLQGTAKGDEAQSIAVDNSGNMYIAGITSTATAGGRDLLIAKLPDDGSLVGTYGGFSYAASSLTDAASSLTDAAAGLTSSDPALSDSASSLVDAPSSLSSSITYLI